MKVANVREFRSKVTTYLKESDTILITRHGKIAGLLYPVKDTDTVPEDLRDKALNMIVGGGQGDAKTVLLKELRSSLKRVDVCAEDIPALQKEWKFKGSLSEEITAEREKR
jgi:hypothetical protein